MRTNQQSVETADATFRRLTPAGRAAVSVWQIEGRDAAEAVASLASPNGGRPLTAGDVRLATVGPPPGEEAVLVPAGGEKFELQTHGGLAVETRVRSLMKSAGVSEASGVSFADECEAAFAAAPTRPAAAWLATVCFGPLESEVRRLAAGPSGAAASGLRRLLKHTAFGLSLTRPRRVTLFGRPNAGKSSLMNRLLGYERSLTDARPGATRDVVSAAAAFGGWPAELSDTAGLREGVTPTEREGVRRARSARDDADVGILVIDRSETADDAVRRAMTTANVVVSHKADQDDRSGLEWSDDAVAVSSQTGAGVAELAAVIGERLGGSEPPGGCLFFVTPRQRDAATAILSDINAAQDAGPGWRVLLGK